MRTSVSESLLDVENIKRKIAGQYVLKGISFKLYDGDILGIIGPNGSGKTTLLSILSNLITNYEGLIKKRNSFNIGTLIDSPTFYDHLTVKENIKLVAHIKKISDWNCHTLLEIVGIDEAIDKKYSQLSLGMKQRLGIAASLLGNPPLIILDEPTNGLDPAGVSDLRDIIRHINSMGVSIIITSHMLSEVSQACNKILILYQGISLFFGSINDLFSSVGPVFKLSGNTSSRFFKKLSKMPFLKSYLQKKDYSIVEIDGKYSAEDVDKWIINNLSSGYSVVEHTLILEDVFLLIIKRFELNYAQTKMASLD